MSTLFGTMATELKNRPQVHPNVDDAFAAIAKAGVPVPEAKQSLASTYKASYCSHGVTKAGDISVLFCEYPNEAGALAGAEESKKLFPGAKSRQSTAHKTVLMVTTFQNDIHPAATTAEQKKVMATFQAL